MKISVREKTINRQIQHSDCVGYAYATAFERLSDCCEMLCESNSGSRILFVNFKNDLPVLSIKHGVGELKSATECPT